ncbi:MAG: methionyl-tRNA formyltransferase [Planctomycetota bacterium]
MRIVFCGTPDYAVPCLKRLWQLTSSHQVVAVVSQPDRPKGRSGALVSPPVVEAARTLGLPSQAILQPHTINQPEVLRLLRALAPDLLCVVAYGHILKKEALALPRLLALNAHGSLLPKFRGAAPIQAALLAGETETGVSIMKMTAGMDRGPYLLHRSVPIRPEDNAGTLHDKLAELSAECCVEAIAAVASGIYTLTAQDESMVTFAPKLEKDSGKIIWNRDALYLERLVRAMNPWPGAWTTVAVPDGSERQRIRVTRATATISLGIKGGSPGYGLAVGAVGDAALIIECGSGALAIQTLQPEGNREMSAAEFMRGAGRKLFPESRWE